jgi:hypothetical protein
MRAAAAGPVKSARLLKEIQRNSTPIITKPMAKWTMSGW